MLTPGCQVGDGSVWALVTLLIFSNLGWYLITTRIGFMVENRKMVARDDYLRGGRPPD